MNVNLIFHQTGYSFQISQFTPLSFIYEVANKVFHFAQNSIKLFYKEQYIPNDQTYASNYFKKFPVIINILELKKSNNSNDNNQKEKIIEEKLFNETFSEKTKQKKKNFIKCQICLKKNSIFYCRNCNQFICFECNIRYPEHFSHKKISLESGDLILCFEDYRNSVLEQLNELNNAYRFSRENIYSDQKRGEIFENLINTLKDLDKKTQSLTIMGTSYKCNNDVLNNFNKELREIEAPKYKEETINSFGLVNEKELEIQNYVSFINLQILKSRFNIKMTIFFNEAKKIFNELMIEINNKLHDSLNLKEKNYNDLVSYNKEKYKENKDNSSSSSPTDSNKDSQSYYSSRSFNKSSSLNLSSTNKNEHDNKQSEKYSSHNNINNINNTNNNPIMKPYKKTSKNIHTDINEKISHKNLNTLKVNRTDGNINVIKSTSSIIRSRNNHININKTTDNILTLPKIKALNDNQRQIEVSKEKQFNSIEKTKKNMINLKNISEIKHSIQNILKKSSQSKDFKKIKQSNLFRIVKMNSKDKKLPSFEMGISNNKQIEPDKIRRKKDDSSIKLKTIRMVVPPHDKDKDNNKDNNDKDDTDIDLNNQNDENKKHYYTINHENTTTIENENGTGNIDKYDKHEANKIIGGLKKIKPNHKIKIYDTYKVKEKEKEKEKEEELEGENSDKENQFHSPTTRFKKSVHKKRIYQKEK
jgi:hypothetical protein